MIRPATLEDAERVRAINEAAYGLYIPRIGRRPAPMDADIEAQIAAGSLWLWDAGALLGGVLGSVVFASDGDVMHLNALAVAPEAAGQGIGKRLVSFVEDEAARLGLRAVALYTNAAMTENLAMYPHLGYTEVARRSEDGFHRVFYEKSISG
jgi:GNAT superfamily N-acetyltransferase